MSGGDSLDFEILGSVTSQLQNLHKIIELYTDGIQSIENIFPRMASKPINNHWIRTGSKPY